jgi:carbamoyl-phosphate synthase large subunit
MELNRNGALARHAVKLIGANAQAIAKGEDRQLFKETMLRIGSKYRARAWHGR